MAATGQPPVGAVERELVITRIVNAPRTLVFQAWTDVGHLQKWWGPKGFTNPVCEIDAKPGGIMRIVMRAPDGAEHPMTATFREVVEPQRLVFTFVAQAIDGAPLLEGLTTVTFEEHGTQTKLTLRTSGRGVGALPARMLEGMEIGWTQSLERLERLVASV
jgi:uncharacterized protein YndB with AHSA1/START domain